MLGERRLKKIEQSTPGTFSLLLVIDLGVYSTPAVQGVFVDFDLGRYACRLVGVPQCILRHGIVFIVIGSHGRHGLALLLGSTANSVLHGASCNVYVVRVQ